MRYQNGKALKDSVPLSVVGYLILPYQNPELCLDFRLHRKAKRVFLPSIWYLPTQSTERAHVDKSRVQRLYKRLFISSLVVIAAISAPPR